MYTENKKQLGVKSTCIYGKIDENSKYYDVRDEVGKSILDYKITKIICQIKSNESIHGIQFIYRNINNGVEKALINVKPRDIDLIEQEMVFEIEDIIDLRIWLADNIKLTGFEVTTNRGRSQKFGYGNDDELRKIPDFENNDNTIVGFCVTADRKNGVTSLFAYYIDRITYSFYIYSGIFVLRAKMKNEEFNQKIKNKLQNLSEKGKNLYKICCLPNNQFFNIIKFALT